jgi:hypothetical protein
LALLSRAKAHRPDIALAVMRVLAARLAAMTTQPVGSRA